jgi:hypothetical protein
MQIEIGDEVAKYVQTKAREAGFDSLEAYILHLVEEQEPSRVEPPPLPYEQWRDQFWAFVSQQKSRNPNFDDSRESIYLGP